MADVAAIQSKDRQAGGERASQHIVPVLAMPEDVAHSSGGVELVIVRDCLRGPLVVEEIAARVTVIRSDARDFGWAAIQRRDTAVGYAVVGQVLKLG
jgi:hypothetical protein